MPKRDEHLAQAQHNREFFEAIERPAYNDWAVTTIFYEAIHYVDALLDHAYGVNPRRYGDSQFPHAHEREGYLRNYMHAIWNDCRHLKDASRDARYECWHPSDDDVETLLSKRDDIQSWILSKLQ